MRNAGQVRREFRSPPRQAGGERQQLVIEPKVDVDCKEPGQSAVAPDDDNDTDDSPENREEDALGQELPDQPATGRSKGEADCDLFSPGHGSREQKIRNIHADDEQD